MSTQYEKVKIFTNESGSPTPAKPEPMTRTQVEFIARMILEETEELLSTVMTDAEAGITLVSLAQGVKDKHRALDTPKDPKQQIADQADALVDIIYYINNAAAKKNMNLDDVFNEVHNSNMSKKFPDGTFHKDEFGKVIKPPTYFPPNIKDKCVEKWYS